MAPSEIDLSEIVRAEKRLLPGPLRWEDKGSDWRVARPRLVLEDATNENLYLRIRCPNREDRVGLMLQTEYQPGGPRTTEPLERLEWRVAHTNGNVGPEAIRLTECESTHLHSFDLNYLDSERRMLRGNLPLAHSVLPEPETLKAFLAFGEKSLRINGLAQVTLPTLQKRFLP